MRSPRTVRFVAFTNKLLSKNHQSGSIFRSELTPFLVAETSLLAERDRVRFNRFRDQKAKCKTQFREVSIKHNGGMMKWYAITKKPIVLLEN